MSPNESQLRAALHEGEGDPIDAGRLIAHAVTVRDGRRRRVRAAVAGVGLVAIVGLGIAALAALRDGNIYAGTRSATTQDAAAGGVQRVPHAATSAAASSTGGPVANEIPASPTMIFLNRLGCPADPAVRTGPAGRLIDGTPAALLVCVYGRTGASHNIGYSTSAESQPIVAALDSGTIERPMAERCSANEALVGTQVLIRVATRSGSGLRELPPVLLRVGCGLITATNGVATRYYDELPVALMSAITASSGSPAVPVKSGSPVH